MASRRTLRLAGLALTLLLGAGCRSEVPEGPSPYARDLWTTTDGQTIHWNTTKCRWESDRGELVELEIGRNDYAWVKYENARNEECTKGLAYQEWHRSLNIQPPPRVQVRQ